MRRQLCVLDEEIYKKNIFYAFFSMTLYSPYMCDSIMPVVYFIRHRKARKVKVFLADSGYETSVYKKYFFLFIYTESEEVHCY